MRSAKLGTPSVDEQSQEENLNHGFHGCFSFLIRGSKPGSLLDCQSAESRKFCIPIDSTLGFRFAQPTLDGPASEILICYR